MRIYRACWVILTNEWNYWWRGLCACACSILFVLTLRRSVWRYWRQLVVWRFSQSRARSSQHNCLHIAPNFCVVSNSFIICFLGLCQQASRHFQSERMPRSLLFQNENLECARRRLWTKSKTCGKKMYDCFCYFCGVLSIIAIVAR